VLISLKKKESSKGLVPYWNEIRYYHRFQTNIKFTQVFLQLYCSGRMQAGLDQYFFMCWQPSTSLPTFISKYEIQVPQLRYLTTLLLERIKLLLLLYPAFTFNHPFDENNLNITTKESDHDKFEKTFDLRIYQLPEVSQLSSQNKSTGFPNFYEDYQQNLKSCFLNVIVYLNYKFRAKDMKKSSIIGSLHTSAKPDFICERLLELAILIRDDSYCTWETLFKHEYFQDRSLPTWKKIETTNEENSISTNTYVESSTATILDLRYYYPLTELLNHRDTKIMEESMKSSKHTFVCGNEFTPISENPFSVSDKPASKSVNDRIKPWLLQTSGCMLLNYFLNKTDDWEILELARSLLIESVKDCESMKGQQRFLSELHQSELQNIMRSSQAAINRAMQCYEVVKPDYRLREVELTVISSILRKRIENNQHAGCPELEHAHLSLLLAVNFQTQIKERSLFEIKLIVQELQEPKSTKIPLLYRAFAGQM
jgi:hypothetical protein